jgi:hypothetical protein
MTRTGYALGMDTTPSDAKINTEALERMVRAFDRAVMGKYGVAVEPPTVEPELQKLERRVIETLLAKEDRAQRVSAHGLSFRQPFRRLKAIRCTIRCLIYNIRLRRYNRNWLKNNIH